MQVLMLIIVHLITVLMSFTAKDKQCFTGNRITNMDGKKQCKDTGNCSYHRSFRYR